MVTPHGLALHELTRNGYTLRGQMETVEAEQEI